MPPFPERESSILAKLKKKKGPGTVAGLEEGKRERGADVNGGPEPASASAAVGPSLKPAPCPSSFATLSPRFRANRAFVCWGEVFFFFSFNIFIDYAITVVPFPPLHSTPSLSLIHI